MAFPFQSVALGSFETLRTRRARRKKVQITIEEIARDVVDSAIKVHRVLGPGLLESAYQACHAHELRKRGHLVECEVDIPLEFEGALIDVGYRIDMRVDRLVLVENKTVEKILPIHQAQLLTYLRLSGLSLGFIINWNLVLLRDGSDSFSVIQNKAPSSWRTVS